MTVGQLKQILNDIDDDVIVYDGNMDEIDFHEFVEYPKQDDQDYLQIWA